MKITNISWIRLATDPRDKVLGMCSLVIDDCLVINEVRVVVGRNRIYVSYPNRAYEPRRKNGSVYPINDELRRAWESNILADFEREYMNFYH